MNTRRSRTRLGLLREKAGFTLQQASRHLGCSVARLNRLEHGMTRPPSEYFIGAIARLYGVTPERVREAMR